MRLVQSLRLICFVATALTLSLAAGARANNSPHHEATKLLPDRIGDFNAVGPAGPLESFASENFNASAAAQRSYQSAKGERFLVALITTTSESGAYALLTNQRRSLAGPPFAESPGRAADVGTAGYLFPNRLLFFKGLLYGEVSALVDSPEQMMSLARRLVDPIDKGTGEIPVLVKHLPDWQNAQQQAVYAVNLQRLKSSLNDQPIINALSFEGGAEGVMTNYGFAQLVIVEFTTPQLAGDNDRRLSAKIQELRSQGQPVPSAYRRVGNYSVFVFNAPSEQSAKELIDKVQYEQVVQWLGDNPYLLEQAQREYYQTTAGVLVAVVKASGLSLLGCLAAGGFLGVLLFSRRRAQQKTAEAFSDAGGMLRLNLDEMTAQDPARLLGPGR